MQPILLPKTGSTFAITLHADMVLCKQMLILCERLCCSGWPASLHRKPHAQQYPLAGLTLVFACLARRLAAPRMCAHTVHTAARNRARNCLRHARGVELEPFQVSKIGTWKSKFFRTSPNAKLTTMRAATWAATATQPHSCAQPFAQLFEAWAW